MLCTIEIKDVSVIGMVVFLLTKSHLCYTGTQWCGGQWLERSSDLHYRQCISSISLSSGSCKTSL